MHATAYGNWKRPIDDNIFGIQSTWLGELRIPFACHVRPLKSSAPPLDVSFHYFARLPTELQFRILRFCNKPTLFRLMQTSHFIRNEASKLFFSDPEAWYCVEGHWLEMGGHPSDGLHDLNFLRRIQRVHITFGLIEKADWADEKICEFWARVQCLFPQANYVMFGDESIYTPDDLPPPKLHRRMYELCPPEINVFVSILRRNDRWERSLWRRAFTQEGDNEVDNKTQELQNCQSHPGFSIIVPNEQFRGKVGSCQLLESQGWAIPCQRKALRVLRLAAVERLHFHERHEAFGCGAPQCDAWFEQPEAFTTHAIKLSDLHEDSFVLPEPYQALFAAGKKRLEDIEQRHFEHERTVLGWWGKAGSKERELAEDELRREIEQASSSYRSDEPLLKLRWLKVMKSWSSWSFSP